ncbi:hypothetical protein F4780DRAFT_339772 [Xylariomycetidae sp. FL0641]|nr:hypothetical protein F4780DRAFT_339772 [Xylariomycetidae sp. FL0641]
MTCRRNTDASVRNSDEITRTQYSRPRGGSAEYQSTAPTSPEVEPVSYSKDLASRQDPKLLAPTYEDDLSPGTSLYPRSSVDTYSSLASSAEYEDREMTDSVEDSDIPPLPIYQHEIEDMDVRPSTPEAFAQLFPSMDRLTIRHDDLTPDGNMNLRVDTIVSGRRKRTIQLFHLRMYDLSKREFSFRRYCRDSGREICNSKRKYTEPPSSSRPHLQRSVTSAVKSLTGRPGLSRTSTNGSILASKSRPETGYSSAEADDEVTDEISQFSFEKKPKARPLPTNVLKLEFSNYARVDLERCGSRTTKRYEFDWWGSKYAWRRNVDRLTDTISFHLLKDGNKNTPIAHIVPETRSPNQKAIDEEAGGWIPPCHMWISDPKLCHEDNGIADVVISTGLMALVDDCIRERWQSQRTRRISVPLTSRTMDVDMFDPRDFIRQLLRRRHSDHRTHSPPRPYRMIAAY